MKILTVDVGTGTQDIFLYDSDQEMENCFKMVMPSPTMMVNKRLRMATRRGEPVLLTGVTMGGGPSGWAAEAHVKAGHDLYATPDAARSFDDDLDKVAATGIKIIGDDEAVKLPNNFARLVLKDFDFRVIKNSFEMFGVSLRDLRAIAVAVFDHGAAPFDMSDRQFRFDYIDKRILEKNALSAFAYLSEDIPEIMTRLKAVEKSSGQLPVPLIVMDTAPAAVLGASFDPLVAQQRRKMIVNIGNFHTLAFRIGPIGIEGVFEHHTGVLNTESLEQLILSLADGTLTHEEVFNHHGHGALIYRPKNHDSDPEDLFLSVTGPRRQMLSGSKLKPHFAVPFGDMMITGCFGLLAASADLLPPYRDTIYSSLNKTGTSGKPPWEAPL